MLFGVFLNFLLELPKALHIAEEFTLVYITGDIHGDLARFNSKEYRDLGKEDTLIICGDFGFLWDNSRQEQRILRKLAAKKFTICFVDGTHENFDLLSAYATTQWNGGKVHQIAPNIYHLLRGQIFTIDGLKIFAFGGGESFDRATRKEHETWWKEEMPSPEQLYEGAKNIDRAGCEVDIIVTHEPPARIKGMLRLEVTVTMKICGLNRYFEELSQICKFRRWYFGAMHCDHSIPPNHTAVFKKLIRLDEQELSPRLPIGKSLRRPAYASTHGRTFKPTADTKLQVHDVQDTPTYIPTASPAVKTNLETIDLSRPSQPRRERRGIESDEPATVISKKPTDTENNYSTAYRDITALIDSILSDERK